MCAVESLKPGEPASASDRAKPGDIAPAAAGHLNLPQSGVSDEYFRSLLGQIPGVQGLGGTIEEGIGIYHDPAMMRREIGEGRLRRHGWRDRPIYEAVVVWGGLVGNNLSASGSAYRCDKGQAA